MAIQSFDVTPARLGKFAGEIIKHAIPVEVLAKTANQLQIPPNKSDTLALRSWVPYGATAAQPNQWTVQAENAITAEGVTPDADTLVPRDVTFVLEQFMVLYSITDKAYDLFEDDLTAATKEQVGERTGLIKEMYLYGKMKAATTKFYGGTAVVTRAGVNATITASLLGKIDRSLKANHSNRMVPILEASQNFGTSSVSQAWIIFHHTDLDWDVAQLPGFTKVADYASRKMICEYETGSFMNFRFVSSPELVPYLGAGAAIGATGLKGTTNVDVYPMLCIAKDSYASVALRGMNAVTPIMLMPGKQDKNDPGGQRGYVGSKWYDAAGILNQGWIHVAEVGVTNL